VNLERNTGRADASPDTDRNSTSRESYPGGKGGAGVFQTIINQIPPHDVYLEPFAGGASVLRNIRPARRRIVADKSPRVVERLRVAARAGEFGGEVLDVLQTCGVRLLEWVDAPSHRRHRGVESVAKRDVVFAYCDPPYVHETRSGRLLYDHEWSRTDHERFLATVVGLKRTFVAVSSYRCRLYDRVLRKWRRIDFRAMTRGGVRIESLYMNFAAPDVLHDFSFVGGDRRARENVRRRVRRLVCGLRSRPKAERLAVLRPLIEAFSAELDELPARLV
jgi:DNA adenine methylase